MFDTDETKSGSGQVLRTVGAVTALLTAIAGLVGALAAIGAFEDDSGSPQTVVAQQPVEDPASAERTTETPAAQAPAVEVGEARQTPVAEPTERPAVEQVPVVDRTSVTLAYLGDAEGCSLGIVVGIGDRTFLPVGTSFVATDVLSGTQTYDVSGTIVCPLSGQCEASGSGSVDVAAGRTFFVQWLNTNFGVCDIVLAN